MELFFLEFLENLVSVYSFGNIKYFGSLYVSVPVALFFVFFPLSYITGKRLMSEDIANDFVIYWFRNTFLGFIVGMFVYAFLATFIPFEKANFLGQVPLFVQIPVYYLIIEFLAYAWHMSLHHFNFLWGIHKKHHENYQLNYANSHRDSFLNMTMFIIFVKLSVETFDIQFLTFLITLTIHEVLSALSHFGTEWDFGRWGYFFLSPRFHNDHHRAVLEAKKEELPMIGNFGASLSFFDYLFRTTLKGRFKP